jgi:hypothetical protein
MRSGAKEEAGGGGAAEAEGKEEWRRWRRNKE